MSEFNAALLLGGLKLVDDKVRRRNYIADMYTRLLREVPGVSFQAKRPQDTHTYKDYSILIDPLAVWYDTGRPSAKTACREHRDEAILLPAIAHADSLQRVL